MKHIHSGTPFLTEFLGTSQNFDWFIVAVRSRDVKILNFCFFFFVSGNLAIIRKILNEVIFVLVERKRFNGVVRSRDKRFCK